MAVIAAVMIITIAFSERDNDSDLCKEVVIRIDNQHENFFVDEQDVTNLITDQGAYVVIGASFNDLNLKAMEQRVKEERFIKKAEIYKDLKGNILVNVTLRRPFARVIREGRPGEFIALDGAILPPSSKFATRTLLVSGDYVPELIRQDLNETPEGKALFKLMNFIDKDKFWKAQVAQIDIDKNLEITMYPQVTKQIVEFGKPENVEDKFRRLKTFYTQILPRKGWNGYRRVNLKYKNQIIAE
ncbi:cell division protein FtsQ/DivIB [Fulvivirga sp. M361]|uniref:cell division protein FtsQ/DivIB n=1 Tax=Fulvivirga sp. M361 TaxID=2594266 RepID=UPI00210695FF|nr:cell division protein FtsQ [Fulvivirga sp. M361]